MENLKEYVVINDGSDYNPIRVYWVEQFKSLIKGKDYVGVLFSCDDEDQAFEYAQIENDERAGRR